MADTTFVAGTVIASTWLNDVNDSVYSILTAGYSSVDILGSWMRRSIYVADHGTDLVAVQTALTRASVAGGGTVICAAGATYTGTALPVIPTGVLLEMNRATFNATLSTGSIYGVRLGNYSGIRNGTINVTSTGSPSAQYIFHACISLGEANSNGGTVGSPSTYSTVHHILIEDMNLSTTRQYCPVIQGQGNVYSAVIRRINIPSSSTCSGIHFDWSDIGSLVSSSNITQTRTDFDAGNCYTTHPHNILIEDIRAGTLSVVASGDLAANVVRLSACYNITARNLSADSVTGSMFRVVGGDLGFEFAPSGVKPYAMKGITLEGQVAILSPTASFVDAVDVDTLADNIYREQTQAAAYSPLIDPLMHGNIIIRGDFVGANAALGYGVRAIQCRGLKVLNSTFQKFDSGIYVDEFTRDIEIAHTAIFDCRAHGIIVGTTALRESTERVSVHHCTVYKVGTAGTGYGLNVNRSIDGQFHNNVFGTKDEATMDIGLIAQDNGVNLNNLFRDNHVLGATLAAYSIGGDVAPYYLNQIRVWDNNTFDLGITQTPISSARPQVPVKVIAVRNRIIKHYYSNISGDPSTGGTWTRGSVIFQEDATAASSVAKSVITTGTLGTLNGLTNAATTNGNPVIVCSLTATTATATAGSYSCVVASATNLRVGLLCSIVGGVTNARIISISGTTLQLDKPIKAVTAAAFTTAGLIEGEVVSINTTTPVTSATVMKVDGTNVTLDTSPVNTQSGRTLSYTAPVFDAWPVI